AVDLTDVHFHGSTSNGSVDPGRDCRRAQPNEWGLPEPFMRDLQCLDCDVVLASMHGRPGPLHGQAPFEVPDVHWQMQIVLQHDDAVAAFAPARDKAVV